MEKRSSFCLLVLKYCDLMKFSLLSLISVFSLYTFNVSAQIVIQGFAPDYVNKVVTINKYTDYFTQHYENINSEKVDSLGYFTFKLSTDRSFPAYIDIENKFGLLYIDPNTDNYKIYFPSVDKKDHPVLMKSYVELLFKDLPENDINNLILDFNYRLDNFLYGDTSSLVRMASHSQEFKDSLDQFKNSLLTLYLPHKNEFLHNYIRYSIAQIEQLSKHEDNNKVKFNIYKFFFHEMPVLYENDAYMIFFNQFYKDHFKNSMFVDIEQIKFTINNQNSLSKLNELLATDFFLKDARIRELVIIRSLGEEFYNYDFIPDNIISILLEIEKTSAFKEHITIAKEMIKAITNLQPGTMAPSFSLKDQHKKEIDLKNFSGKYIYLNFFTSSNPQCILEMDVIERLEKKYHKNIHFISICIDMNIENYINYINTHKDLKWPVCYYNGDVSIINDYKVLNTPKYIFINPDGTINQIPAYTPLPNGINESIENTFFNIYRNNKKEKTFKIGGKN